MKRIILSILSIFIGVVLYAQTNNDVKRFNTTIMHNLGSYCVMLLENNMKPKNVYDETVKMQNDKYTWCLNDTIQNTNIIYFSNVVDNYYNDMRRYFLYTSTWLQIENIRFKYFTSRTGMLTYKLEQVNNDIHVLITYIENKK